MPKYRNTTNADITVGVRRFPANSEMEVGSYVEGALPAGLVFVSDEPAFNPIVFREKYIKTTGSTWDVSVPEGLTKGCIIEIYVESGETKASFNEDLTAEANTPIFVVEGQTWTRKIFANVVDKIYFRQMIGGNVYLTISELY
jgi:hypothetical protein